VADDAAGGRHRPCLLKPPPQPPRHPPSLSEGLGELLHGPASLAIMPSCPAAQGDGPSDPLERAALSVGHNVLLLNFIKMVKEMFGLGMMPLVAEKGCSAEETAQAARSQVRVFVFVSLRPGSWQHWGPDTRA
jgi:hypothetical protein